MKAYVLLIPFVICCGGRPSQQPISTSDCNILVEQDRLELIEGFNNIPFLFSAREELYREMIGKCITLYMEWEQFDSCDELLNYQQKRYNECSKFFVEDYINGMN